MCVVVRGEGEREGVGDADTLEVGGGGGGGGAERRILFR